MSVDKVWLTAESAAAYLDYPATKAGVHAFREWARCRRDTLVPRHRGSRLLYARADLDRAIGATGKRHLDLVKAG